MRTFSAGILSALLFLIAIWNPADAQTTVHGTVTDAETGEPLPGVNIFLANTTAGTSSDSEGRYEIDDIAAGIYVLRFTFIGYESRMYQLTSERKSMRRLDVSLQPRPLEMGEIEVFGSNRTWNKQYERFKREFIGKSRFSDQVLITNKEVLNFSEDPESNDLLASTEEPLRVENHALGYVAHLYLDQFRWSRSGNTGRYRVYPRFEEMSPQNESQKDAWIRNRRAAYQGSFRHFMKSLFEQNIEGNDFSMSKREQPVAIPIGEERYELLHRHNASPDLADVLTGFKLEGRARVEYQKSSALRGSKTRNFSIDTKRSSFTSTRESGIFFVDQNGNILNPTSLTISGDWIHDRFAESLPFDYQVPQ